MAWRSKRKQLNKSVNERVQQMVALPKILSETDEGVEKVVDENCREGRREDSNQLREL